MDHRGNAVSNFFNSIFIVKQVVLLFSGINVQWPKVLFSQVFKKTNCNAFKNVIYNGYLLTTRIQLSWLIEGPSLLFHEETLVFHKA